MFSYVRYNAIIGSIQSHKTVDTVKALKIDINSSSLVQRMLSVYFCHPMKNKKPSLC